MSELIQKHDNRATIRWKLLTGASALAISAYVSSTAIAKAEDASRPQLWIELGGSLDRLQDSQEKYALSFAAPPPTAFPAPEKYERPPLFGFSENAALTFQPEGSDWLFSASIRYGRASSSKHVRHQTAPGSFHKYSTTGAPISSYKYPRAAKFADVTSKQTESNAIVDFEAGKDVGLGLFGHNASSSLSLGVRAAQFTSNSEVAIQEDPDWAFHPRFTRINLGSVRHPKYKTELLVFQPYHTYDGTFSAERSFHGVGPSLSWKSSVPFAGNPQDAELTLDWGVNAALLFGRQRAKTRHQTTAWYHSEKTRHQVTRYPLTHHITQQYPDIPHTRSRNVTVPNVGGFAALSYNYADAKLSFGYKADFFFNAIDGGIDTRKNENRSFFGPYASISIGLGD